MATEGRGTDCRGNRGCTATGGVTAETGGEGSSRARLRDLRNLLTTTGLKGSSDPEGGPAAPEEGEGSEMGDPGTGAAEGSTTSQPSE